MDDNLFYGTIIEHQADGLVLVRWDLVNGQGWKSRRLRGFELVPGSFLGIATTAVRDRRPRTLSQKRFPRYWSSDRYRDSTKSVRVVDSNMEDLGRWAEHGVSHQNSVGEHLVGRKIPLTKPGKLRKIWYLTMIEIS